MFIAWTTVGSQEAADELASGAVTQGLAACAQIDGPVVSHYRWENEQHRETEFRLLFKCLPDKLLQLETYVMTHHPYSTPEWLVVRADQVGEKYLSWARSTGTNQPL